MKTYYVTLVCRGDGRYQERVRARNPINALIAAQKKFKRDNIIRNLDETFDTYGIKDYEKNWSIDISIVDKWNMVE